MSKTERRKLFQPIPLSSILDQSHHTPFSKLEQFQFDLDLSKVHSHRPEVERISLWRQLQTTLINAMSNLVVISQPVFATSMGRSTPNSATAMSLVPWKSNKSCELSEVINLTEDSTSPLLSPSKHGNHPQSLYHSVRSGLECLRYFATHPLQEEKAKQVHNCSTTPRQTSRMMDGAGSEFEIIIHATSHQSSHESAITMSPTFKSGTTGSSPSSLPAANDESLMSDGASCIRVTNWRNRNNNEDNRPFHSVSVCSSSSSKGGTVTFACSSATVTSSSPRSLAMPCPRGSGGRRLKTESESSVDSFVEFSASVESTDSFCIVFESAGPCIDEEYVLEFDRDEDEWEDEDDEDDSEDEEDQVFDYAAEADGEIFQTDIDDGNEPQFLLEQDQTDGTSCSATGTKKQKTKMVSFDEDNLESIIEFEDDADSRRARETYWEVFARDRARFQDRILRTGDILEPILSLPHRTKVFSSRFQEL